MKQSKIIKFNDDSKLRVFINDSKITLILQARHLGKEIKFTSVSVELTQEETFDLINWIGSKLIEDVSDV